MRKQSIANAGKTHFRHIGRNLIIQSRESMTNGAYSPRGERRKVRKRMALIKKSPETNNCSCRKEGDPPRYYLSQNF